MKRLPPSQIIAEYEKAFRSAMGVEPPSVSYDGGWFMMRPHGIRYRGAHLIHMTAQLNERAKAKG